MGQLPQGQIIDRDTAKVLYGSWPMHSQEQPRVLAQGNGVPQFWGGEWPNYIRHLPRLWSQGLGAQAAATSYGWPYEDTSIRLVPPPVPAMQMMARGSMAAVARPGGGGWGWGSGRIPSTPVPINYSRTSY